MSESTKVVNQNENCLFKVFLSEYQQEDEEEEIEEEKKIKLS